MKTNTAVSKKMGSFHRALHSIRGGNTTDTKSTSNTNNNDTNIIAHSMTYKPIPRRNILSKSSSTDTSFGDHQCREVDHARHLKRRSVGPMIDVDVDVNDLLAHLDCIENHDSSFFIYEDRNKKHKEDEEDEVRNGGANNDDAKDGREDGFRFDITKNDSRPPSILRRRSRRFTDGQKVRASFGEIGERQRQRRTVSFSDRVDDSENNKQRRSFALTMHDSTAQTMEDDLNGCGDDNVMMISSRTSSRDNSTATNYVDMSGTQFFDRNHNIIQNTAPSIGPQKEEQAPEDLLSYLYDDEERKSSPRNSATPSSSRRNSLKKVEPRQPLQQQKQKQKQPQAQQLPKQIKYRLGSISQHPTHMQTHTDILQATSSASTLKMHEYAFIKRSNGDYVYSILADRYFEKNKRNGHVQEVMIFVISPEGHTKKIKMKYWGDLIRKLNGEVFV